MDWEVLRGREPIKWTEIEKAICNKCGHGMIYHGDHKWYCPYSNCTEHRKLKSVEELLSNIRGCDISDKLGVSRNIVYSIKGGYTWSEV